jgi:hypothetical protein
MNLLWIRIVAGPIESWTCPTGRKVTQQTHFCVQSNNVFKSLERITTTIEFVCVCVCEWLIRVSDLERRMHDLATLYPQDVQSMRDELEQHKQILGNARD